MQLLSNIMVEQRQLRCLVDNIKPQSKTVPHDCPQFPLKSSEELIMLNKYLKKTDRFRKVCHYFQSFGGPTSAYVVKRILGTIMDKDLCTKYNWRGLRGEKDPFCVYGNIIEMIATAVRQHAAFEKTTDHEIEDCIKKWLMHAKDRNGSRYLERKKNKI